MHGPENEGISIPAMSCVSLSSGECTKPVEPRDIEICQSHEEGEEQNDGGGLIYDVQVLLTLIGTQQTIASLLLHSLAPVFYCLKWRGRSWDFVT